MTSTAALITGLLLSSLTTISCTTMEDGAVEETAGDPGQAGQVDQPAPAEATSTVHQGLTYPKVINTCVASAHDVAFCDAFCPAGYMATGGGCRTDTVHWEVSESYPILGAEGWHCLGNEDFKTGVYNRTVTGYVVCIQF